MIIVDSKVWIDFARRTQNPHTLWLRENADVQTIGLTDLILSEVLQGTRNQLEFRQTLERFGFLSVLPCAGTAMAVASARNYILLRERGITGRKTIGCLIATFCIQNGHTLLHHDRDFDHFEQHLGLRVVKV